MTESIIIANRLDDGRVVYFTGKQWTPSVTLAHQSLDRDLTEKFLEKARNHSEANHLLGIESIPLSDEGSGNVAFKLRDRIRIEGPTIKFGKSIKLIQEKGG